MYRFAHIESGKVVNVIEIDDVSIFSQWQLIRSDSADIGDLWDGQSFSKPVPIVVVPAQVNDLQFRLALNELGLRTSVEYAISSSDQDTKDMWQFSRSIERANPKINAVAEALGVPSDRLDSIFILADTK